MQKRLDIGSFVRFSGHEWMIVAKYPNPDKLDMPDIFDIRDVYGRTYAIPAKDVEAA